MYQITEDFSVKEKVIMTELCSRLWCCTLQ